MRTVLVVSTDDEAGGAQRLARSLEKRLEPQFTVLRPGAETVLTISRHGLDAIVVFVTPFWLRQDWSGPGTSLVRATLAWAKKESRTQDVVVALYDPKQELARLVPEQLKDQLTRCPIYGLGDISWEQNASQLAAYLVTHVPATRARPPTTLDVFLCHNSEDKPAVRNIAENLKKMGLKPWLDEVDLRPGFSHQRQLGEEIDRANAAAVFVGDKGMGPWEDEEVEALLAQLVDRDIPVIPVLLERAPPGKPALPVFLRSKTWVDFRVHHPDPYSRLYYGITGVRIDS